MLDPDAVAEFEKWKMHKMTEHLDLSVQAFNAEMEAGALAYEAGVKDMAKKLELTRGDNNPVILAVIEDSPYRKPGMRGERSASPISPTSRRVTGPVEEIPDHEDEEEH